MGRADALRAGGWRREAGDRSACGSGGSMGRRRKRFTDNGFTNHFFSVSLCAICGSTKIFSLLVTGQASGAGGAFLGRASAFCGLGVDECEQGYSKKDRHSLR